MNNEDDISIRKIDEKVQVKEEQEEITPPTQYDISIYPADFTLEVLHQKYKDSEIVIPDIQRGFVWTLKQSSLLIDSFLMGLPIPSIFLYRDEEEKLLVIDGNQRLRTISYFFDGYFKIESKIFELDGLDPNSPYYKKTFQCLDISEQRKFKNRILRAMIITQNTPKMDNTSIYHIFERLNTGGSVLKDQEIRNCVYRGKLNDLLIDLNKYENWRKILGKEVLDPRQNDVQLILRYMALLHNGKNYKKPMKEFLTKFMVTNQNPQDSFLKQEEYIFKRTCDVIIKDFGYRPLHPKGGLNPSIFDAIFIAFAENLNSIPNDIKTRFKLLQNNSKFKELMEEATTDPKVVENRLQIAKKVLFG